MKSENEIFEMLLSELYAHFDDINSVTKKQSYYNEILGDTSFLLAGFLGLLLNKNFTTWDKSKWFDDSLVSNVEVTDKTIALYGVMIWGRDDTTEQWTEPFYFEISLLDNRNKYDTFLFLFGDADKDEITYEDFASNRNFWDGNKRNWKYVLNEEMLGGK